MHTHTLISCDPSERTRLRRDQITQYPTGRLTYGSNQTVTITNRYDIPPKPIGGKRGGVTKFSTAARSRLKSRLNNLDWLAGYLEDAKGAASGRSFFVSLNCPKNTSYTQKEFTALRSHFFTMLTRRYKNEIHGGVWKAELQQDGTPHLHIILFFTERQQRSELSKFISTAWTKVTKCNDNCFIASAVDVQACYRSLDSIGCPKLIDYMAKPVMRAGQEWTLGRIWGCYKEKYLPTCETVIILSEGELTELSKEIMISCLKEHPTAGKHPKVQKLTSNWKGWTLDLNPGVTEEVVQEYQRQLTKYLA